MLYTRLVKDDDSYISKFDKINKLKWLTFEEF